MRIDVFEKREQVLELREKVKQAEKERLSGAETKRISEARKELRDRIYAVQGASSYGERAFQNPCAAREGVKFSVSMGKILL